MLERSPTAQPYPESTNRIVYAASLILLAIGSTLVLYLFVTSQRQQAKVRGEIQLSALQSLSRFVPDPKPLTLNPCNH
jgi:hypothetical protein